MFKKNIKFNKGMSYVELIVVISIFGIMSSVVLVTNKGFEKKVEIKNLSNDIALSIVQAQKEAISGLNSDIFLSEKKPAYGVYFNKDNGNNDKFSYFADKNNNGIFENGEDLAGSPIGIGNNNYVKELIINSSAPAGGCNNGTVHDLNIVFTRPSSIASIKSSSAPCVISEAEITVSAPEGSPSAKIQIYASGRVQINNN